MERLGRSRRQRIRGIVLVAIVLQVIIGLTRPPVLVFDIWDLVQLMVALALIYAALMAGREEHDRRRYLLYGAADRLRIPITLLRGYLCLVADGDKELDPPTLKLLQNTIDVMNDEVDKLLDEVRG